MTLSRRTRLIKLATARHDVLALATLAPGKPWTPERDFRIFTGVQRLRIAA